MVQVAPVAKVEGQLLVCPNSPELVPVKPTLVMVKAVPLGFESVTTLAALDRKSVVQGKCGDGGGGRLGGAVHGPDTPEDGGLLMEMSVTVKVALRVPAAVGVRVHLVVEVEMAAHVVEVKGQLLVCPNSPELVPVKPTLVMVKAVPLGFESVTTLAA